MKRPTVRNDGTGARPLGRRAILGAGLAAGAAGLTGLSTADAAPAETPPSPPSSTAIDARTIAEAAKIHAIKIPGDTVAIAVGQVQAQVASIEAIRALPRPRDLQPAFRFEPRMPGKSYPPQKNEVRLAGAAPVPLPRDDADIAFAPVVQLSAWIKAGQLSSERLTGIYLERIGRLDPRLLSYITVGADAARAEARALDAERKAGKWRGPLHGIPYAMKDVIDTAGVATTWGSNLFRDRVPTKDATVVTMLRRAGAVLLGKAATGELAFGATWYGGECRNPWNTAEAAGGSSCGPGAATAAALCAFAIGTDSLGSILNPADRCGVVGLRPTFGRVPVAGGMPLTPTLERIGPLCRSIEDAALVLAAINGPDPTSANSADMGFSYRADTDLSKLRIGWSPNWFKTVGFAGAGDARVSDGHLRALELARASGATMVELDLPDLPYATLLQTLAIEAAAVFEDLTLSGRDAGLLPKSEQVVLPNWADMWRAARFFSAVDYLQLERFRRQVMQAMDGLFDRADMLMAPTYGNFNLLLVTNFTGHPGLTFRCGFDHKPTRNLMQRPVDPAGVPHKVTCNISLHGRLFEEGRMLAFARALEAKLDVMGERPALA